MITSTDEIKELLSNKYILLDNNVITRASDHQTALLPFLQLLLDSNCKPMIVPMVKFEYLRGAHTVIHKSKRQEMLDVLNPDIIPGRYTDENIDLAIKIANAYTQRDLKTPNIVDCSLAAHVVGFSGNLFLATLNHKDFPTFLFDRTAVFTVDTEKDVLPIGIYGFNHEKALSLKLVDK